MHLNFCYAFEMLRMHMHNYSRCFAVFRPLLVYVHECVEFFSLCYFIACFDFEYFML